MNILIFMIFCLDKSGSDKCKDDEFRCHADGSCVPADWRCDGIVDCVRDAADEEDCSEYCHIFSIQFLIPSSSLQRLIALRENLDANRMENVFKTGI